MAKYKKETDERPRYGHVHNGTGTNFWSKITFVSFGRGYVTARRPGSAPFVLHEHQWLAFPLWDGQKEGWKVE